MGELDLGVVRELSVDVVENGLVQVPGDHDGKTALVAVVDDEDELVERNESVMR